MSVFEPPRPKILPDPLLFWALVVAGLHYYFGLPGTGKPTLLFNSGNNSDRGRGGPWETVLKRKIRVSLTLHHFACSYSRIRNALRAFEMLVSRLPRPRSTRPQASLCLAKGTELSLRKGEGAGECKTTWTKFGSLN